MNERSVGKSLAAAGLAALFAAGCTTGRLPEPGAGATPDTVRGVASVADAKLLTLGMNMGPAEGPEAATVAEAIRRAVEGRLAGDGFALGSGAPDVVISLAVKPSLFDQSGNFYRFDGTVSASVERAWDKRKLGGEDIAVKGERGLGREEALRKLSDQLAGETAQFISESCAPARAGVAASDVTVRRPPLARHDDDYASKFIGTVMAMPGVVYCALVSHDYGSKTLVFRVVYLADAFPEGLLNRLSQTEALSVKPRD